MKNKIGILLFAGILFFLGGCSGGMLKYEAEETTIVETIMPEGTAAEEEQPPEVVEKGGRSLSVVCGYNKWIKVGRNLRILAYLSNEAEDLQGELYVTIPNVTFGNTTYQTSFNVKTGETGRIEMAIPVYMGVGSEVVFDVRDLSGKEILRQTVPIEISYYEKNAYVGVLSHEADFLNYVQGSGVKAFLLNPKDFPEDKMCLDSLDCIVLHNFDTADLSVKQQQALQAFEAEGNVRIINEEGYDGLSETIVNQLSEEKKKAIERESYGDNQYYQAFNSAEAKSGNGIPRTAGYGVILLCYLLVIGPPMYLVLKKINRQGAMWLVIPAMSVLFTLIMYGLGSKTRLVEPYIGYLTVSHIKENAVEEEVFFTLSSPYNDDYAIRLPKEYHVESVDTMQWSSGLLASYQQIHAETEKSVQKYKKVVALAEDYTGIEIKDTAAFSTNYFLGKMTKETDMEEAPEEDSKTCVFGEVTVTPNYRIAGAVVNRTGYDLTNAFLCVGDIYVNIGNLKQNQEVTVDNLPQMTAATPVIMNEKKILESFTGGVPYGRGRDEKISRSYYAYDYLMNLRWNGLIYREGMLAGIAAEDYSGDLFSQIDLETKGIHVVTAKVAENSTVDGETFIQNLDSYAEMREQRIDQYRYLSEENQQVTYQFAPEDKIKEVIYSEELNSEFMENIKIGFFGTIKAFNFETQKYDIIFESGKAGSLTNPQPYLGESNQMVLIYDITGHKEKDYANTAPVLSAVMATVKEAE